MRNLKKEILDKEALMAYGGGTDATEKLKKELGL